MDSDKSTLNVLWLVLVGILTGIGQLLVSNNPLTARLVIGRALSSGALGLAAGACLMCVPDLPFEAVIGLSSVSASLGTSGLERILQRVVSV